MLVLYDVFDSDFLDEAVVIIHNGVYSVSCVRISWRKHNGFRSLQSS